MTTPFGPAGLANIRHRYESVKDVDNGGVLGQVIHDLGEVLALLPPSNDIPSPKHLYALKLTAQKDGVTRQIAGDEIYEWLLRPVGRPLAMDEQREPGVLRITDYGRGLLAVSTLLSTAVAHIRTAMAFIEASDVSSRTKTDWNAVLQQMADEIPAYDTITPTITETPAAWDSYTPDNNFGPPDGFIMLDSQE